MNARLILVCLTFAICTVFANNATQEPKLWALLVAGSNYWYNYRHQADICHAYQILHARGIPDENIVVMMYDDIANNQQNPTKGEIINHPDGTDVYKGVVKDYTGRDVTPKNFFNVLQGNKEAMKNIGSGKVIESGPNDHIFVNFVDHGSTGVLSFPIGEMTAKELNDALNKMYKEKRYGKLVFYIEACESGSMFRQILSDKINVFATTAADYDEPSKACYYDNARGTYLGDSYSVNWMEDSEKENLATATLQKQFNIVKNITDGSHVMEYGDMTISQMVVSEFQGKKAVAPKSLPKVANTDSSPSWEVPMDILYKKQAMAKNEDEKESIRLLIDEMIEKRSQVETVVKKNHLTRVRFT